MIFFALFPKSSAANDQNSLTSLAETVCRSFAPFLGPRYSRTAIYDHDITTTGGLLIRFEPSAQQNQPFHRVRKGRWAVATSPNVVDEILTCVTSKTGRLRYESSVWGSYATLVGDKGTDRIYGWATVPSLETLHYGQSDQFIVVSNRPLLAALTLNDGSLHRIQLDDKYALEYLNFGYSVSGVTPFHGVTTLPPRSSLQIAGGSLSIGAAPEEPELTIEESKDRWSEGVPELVNAFKASVQRSVANRSTDSVQLRLSGGLDSRLMLGLFKDIEGIELTAVTQGSKDSQEVMVAAELAERAKVSHLVVVPSPIDPSSWINSLAGSIRESQGMIPSESLVAPYKSAAPLSPGENLVAGQWPLFKGVLDKAANNSLDRVRATFSRIDAQLLNPELNVYTQDVFGQWLSSVAALSNLELLYMHGYDLRSSRYLQPHSIQIDRESQVMYPFCDSEVVAAAKSLPTINRMQNISAFLALREIWEESLKVPHAYGKGFRFEANQPLSGVSGPDYEARYGAPRPYNGPVWKQSENGPDFSRYFTNPIGDTAAWIVRHTEWEDVKALLSDEFSQSIERVAGSPSNVVTELFPVRAGRKIFNLRLQRVALVLLWRTKSWLE
ncbi:Asparagine synthase [Corynebacterium coyleae]|nr:hypothetical protein HMPREF3120_11020 [Corynebacterium sp. HMSC11D10]WJY80353.1 Asparagine synthase [Corynebacterium coyleae]SEB41563.1 Asparagine synthase [Corynebacterium coyleae]